MDEQMAHDAQEGTLRTRGGLQIAAKLWGRAGATPILATHGWMDNAASFDGVAPLLADDHRLVALDFPGHGKSAHRSKHQTYYFIEYVHDVIAAADALGWERFHLLGHSMGASVAALVAGTFPERIASLSLLEGLGPLTTAPEEAPAQLAKAIRAHASVIAQPARPSPGVDGLVDRMLAKRSPMEREGARLIAQRVAVEEEGAGVRFGHDPMLLSPSKLRLTEAHVLAFLGAISAPSLLVLGEDGLRLPDSMTTPRLQAMRNLQLVEVPGGHHVHLDAPERVAPLILEHIARAS
ncbi:MAG: alpha/beta hydrolase [Myxococcota bacterium]